MAAPNQPPTFEDPTALKISNPTYLASVKDPLNERNSFARSSSSTFQPRVSVPEQRRSMTHREEIEKLLGLRFWREAFHCLLVL